MFWVHVEVVVIDGKWLGALSNAGHKLLHLQKSTARPVAFKVPHRNIGGSDAIWSIESAKKLGDLGKSQMKNNRECTANILRSLLVISGATLSIVTSRLPKSTGSLAIFSGLLGKTERDTGVTATYQFNYSGILKGEEYTKHTF